MTNLTLLYGFLRGLLKAVYVQWAPWIRAARNRGGQVIAWIVFVGLPLTILQLACITAIGVVLAFGALVYDLVSMAPRRPSSARAQP